MRFAAVTVACLLGLASGEAAAKKRTARAEKPKRELDKAPPGYPKHGGFGFMSLGIMTGQFGELADDLGQSRSLGDGVGPIEFGYTIGGGGRMLLFRRVLIGGKGFGLFTPRVGGQQGQAQLTGGGGGIDVGAAIVSRPDWLAYPFFGAGGFGYGLVIENTSPQAVRFGSSQTIEPGADGEFAGGFAYLEPGFGVQRMFLWNGGGIMIGAELGGMFAVSPTTWSDSDDNDILGVHRPRLNTFYFKITIGGGGFFLTK